MADIAVASFGTTGFVSVGEFAMTMFVFVMLGELLDVDVLATGGTGRLNLS